jgi:hypothetical protein
MDPFWLYLTKLGFRGDYWALGEERFNSEVTYWFREEDDILIQYSIAGRTDRYESTFMARIDPQVTW